MALSTRATIAAVGGALAIGALGITGVAYAGGDEATPQYVTTVQEDGTAAPAEGTAADRDCPEKSGSGSGSGSAEGSGSPESSAPESSTADDA